MKIKKCIHICVYTHVRAWVCMCVMTGNRPGRICNKLNSISVSQKRRSSGMKEGINVPSLYTRT